MVESKDKAAESKAEEAKDAKAADDAALDEDIAVANTPEEQEAAAQQDRDQNENRPLTGSEGGQAPPKEEPAPEEPEAQPKGR